MILFFDTETTGKADFKAQPHAPHQPRLVQFAALLCDPKGEVVSSVDLVIKPEAMTPICDIPGPYGPKWPRLQEAHKHVFGKEFDGAHDALADVIACKNIYFWILSQQKAKASAALEKATD